MHGMIDNVLIQLWNFFWSGRYENETTIEEITTTGVARCYMVLHGVTGD